MTRYELKDSAGRVLSLRTSSESVELMDGKLLADYEPVYPVADIHHDLDTYPYVVLVHLRPGERAVLLPVGVTYAGRDSLTVYTMRGEWGGASALQKIRSREYLVRFESGDELFIGLL